jgi:hypothetical protein
MLCFLFLVVLRKFSGGKNDRQYNNLIKDVTGITKAYFGAHPGKKDLSHHERKNL